MTQDFINTTAEAARLRRMAEPADMAPFWQRQIELTQGRIEPVPRRTIWMRLLNLLRGYNEHR